MKLNDVKPWILPFTAQIGLIILVVVSAVLYHKNKQRFETTRSEQIAFGVSRGLRIEIENRIKILKVLTKSEALEFNSQRFQNLADVLISEYPGFYAINFVDKNGFIRRVYPAKENSIALGENLLLRDDLKNYLLESKADGKPRMSHRIMTYQKIHAFTLYIPVFKDDQFNGWLNAVIDFDSWIERFLKENKHLSHIRVRINWDHPDSSAMDHGLQSVTKLYNYDFNLLNQRIKIGVGLGQGVLDQTYGRLYSVLMFFGLALLLMTSAYLYGLMISRSKLTRANSRLTMNNTLLSSLTHDISSPIMTLNMNLEGALNTDNPLTAKQKERISRSLKSIEEMHKSARYLYAQDLGLLKNKLDLVPLLSAVQNAISVAADQTDQKDITFKIDSFPEDLSVVSDPMTLTHNVLLNVLTNAVKFSPPGEKILISTVVKSDSINLIVEDRGHGFSDDQLQSFHNYSTMESKSGTRGERGLGLGLLQIATLMTSYGGRMSLSNRDKAGARVILMFRRTLPASKDRP